MRRSRTNWAIGVIAPWCLAMGLLVSITADAGQNATVGGSLAALNAEAAAEPRDLVPVETRALTGDIDSFGIGGTAAGPERLLTPVSFELGRPEELAAVSDEIDPRIVMKAATSIVPVIDRTHKGDSELGLRPSFDTRVRRPGGARAYALSQMIAPHDEAMPAASFSIHDNGGPLDGTMSFAPWNEGEDPQDAIDAATRTGSAAIAMRPAALKERLDQGATPKVSRAEALSSTTPAPADAMPIEASFLPQQLKQLQLPNASIVTRYGGHQTYASLLVGEHGLRERKCLAEAVYFESRSEPEEGQAAVAQVILNRATSGLYPASICGVVYQNRTHYMACQFSFACEGKSLRITDPASWRTAVRIANEVIDGKTYLSDVGGATHYHANYVRPGWARRLVKMDVIGHHVFYKLRPGQT